jgi:hypothetical protein
MVSRLAVNGPAALRLPDSGVNGLFSGKIRDWAVQGLFSLSAIAYVGLTQIIKVWLLRSQWI